MRNCNNWRDREGDAFGGMGSEKARFGCICMRVWRGGTVLMHLMVDLLNLCVGLLYYLGLCGAGAGVRQYRGMNRTESWFEVEAIKSGVSGRSLPELTSFRCASYSNISRSTTTTAQHPPIPPPSPSPSPARQLVEIALHGGTKSLELRLHFEGNLRSVGARHAVAHNNAMMSSIVLQSHEQLQLQPQLQLLPVPASAWTSDPRAPWR